MRRTGLVLALLLSATSAARADVYGYIDPVGQLHLATERLDDRYTLFMKSRDGSAAVADASGTAVDPTFMKSRVFQRLVDHPNIARYEPMIRSASKRHNLDPDLVKAVIAVESGFDADAVSDKGAVGLMQVLPATGARYGVHADRKKTVDAKLTDPTLNLEIGTRYLSDLRAMFPDRPELVLAAYNAGENAVIRYRNTVPPFAETQAYVHLVDQFHAFYSPKTSTTERLRVTIPGRRNLPDPNAPPRLDPGTGVVVEPAANGGAAGDAALPNPN